MKSQANRTMTIKNLGLILRRRIKLKNRKKMGKWRYKVKQFKKRVLKFKKRQKIQNLKSLITINSIFVVSL